MPDQATHSLDVDALVFDVGGVFVIPHPDPIAQVLADRNNRLGSVTQ